MNSKIKVNHKYYFCVSEPWEYNHPKYGIEIPGIVIEANDEWVIFKCDDFLEFDNDIKGNILILMARHKGYKANDKNASFNAGILYINYKKYRNVESKFVFIGGIKPKGIFR